MDIFNKMNVQFMKRLIKLSEKLIHPNDNNITIALELFT